VIASAHEEPLTVTWLGAATLEQMDCHPDL
jgi:hypothetical protein